MHSSKVIAAVLDGSYWDKIVGFLRYGEQRAPLDDEHREILGRLERTKDLWLHHKDDTLVVNLVKKEYDLSTAQAYRYVADAKALFALMQRFDLLSELFIEKERIDRLIKRAEENDELSYSKRIDKLVEVKLEILKRIDDEIRAQKPDEPKKFKFVYHNDWSKIPGGLSASEMEAMEREFDEITIKARRRFTKVPIVDADYTEITTERK